MPEPIKTLRTKVRGFWSPRHTFQDAEGNTLGVLTVKRNRWGMCVSAEYRPEKGEVLFLRRDPLPRQVAGAALRDRTPARRGPQRGLRARARSRRGRGRAGALRARAPARLLRRLRRPRGVGGGARGALGALRAGRRDHRRGQPRGLLLHPPRRHRRGGEGGACAHPARRGGLLRRDGLPVARSAHREHRGRGAGHPHHPRRGAGQADLHRLPPVLLRSLRRDPGRAPQPGERGAVRAARARRRAGARHRPPAAARRRRRSRRCRGAAAGPGTGNAARSVAPRAARSANWWSLRS